MKRKNNALFLDIDGVVLYDPGYVTDPKKIVFLDGVPDALLKAQKIGFILIFISNKGGVIIKKGLTMKMLNKLDMKFKSLLKNYGVDMKKIASYYCPHYPESEEKGDICNCRKPKAGLYEQAIKDFSIDTSTSFVIGDKLSDLIPGLQVGCREAFLVKRNQKYFDIKTSSDLNKYNNMYRFKSLNKVIDNLIT